MELFKLLLKINIIQVQYILIILPTFKKKKKKMNIILSCILNFVHKTRKKMNMMVVCIFLQNVKCVLYFLMKIDIY